MRIQQAALDEIIPAAEHDNRWEQDFFILPDEDWRALGQPNERKVFIARRGDSVVGFILPIKPIRVIQAISNYYWVFIPMAASPPAEWSPIKKPLAWAIKLIFGATTGSAVLI